MRAVIIANPRSGRGKGVALANRAAADLNRAGVRAERVDIGPGLPPVDLSAVTAGADATVVAGGDGTVRSVAAACVQTGVPLYHLPSGNENLFAREFGMTRKTDHLLAALRRNRVIHTDAGVLTRQGHPVSPLFLIMASIGPDAGVCHRLHTLRQNATGYLAYARPIIEEFGNPAVARMKVWADGAKVAEGRGMVVVANYRQYALRVDPCPDAQWHDGQFDVVFIPVETAIDTLTALARLRLRWPSPDIIHARGSTIRLEMTGNARLQMDGEAETCLDGSTTQTIEYVIRTGVMPVLDAR